MESRRDRALERNWRSIFSLPYRRGTSTDARMDDYFWLNCQYWQLGDDGEFSRSGWLKIDGFFVVLWKRLLGMRIFWPSSWWSSSFCAKLSDGTVYNNLYHLLHQRWLWQMWLTLIVFELIFGNNHFMCVLWIYINHLFFRVFSVFCIFLWPLLTDLQIPNCGKFPEWIITVLVALNENSRQLFRPCTTTD